MAARDCGRPVEAFGSAPGVILAGAFGKRLWVESDVLLNSMLGIDMRFNRMPHQARGQSKRGD
jgi:hypothetical protein